MRDSFEIVNMESKLGLNNNFILVNITIMFKFKTSSEAFKNCSQ